MQMATQSLLRTADPLVGTNAVKSAGIETKFSNRSRTTQEEAPKPVNITAGYRSLMRDDTLAGRQAARNFKQEERGESSSRLRMVNRLRQKEKWLLWREFFREFDHMLSVCINRMTPGNWNH